MNDILFTLSLTESSIMCEWCKIADLTLVVIDLKRNTFCHVSQLEQLLMGAHHLYPTGPKNIYQEVLRHPSVT